MLKTFIRALPICLVMALLSSGCGEEKITKPKPVGLRLTPLADAEAELMALWLSAEIEAPLDLYERVRADLAALRSNFGSTPPLDSISFTSPYEPGFLLFDFGPFGREELLNHASPVWDSLNALYKPVFDTTYQRAAFPGRLNSMRLAEAYARVSQISDGGVGLYVNMTFGGWWPSQITPGVLGGDTMVYLFQHSYQEQPISAPDSIAFWCYYATPNAKWSAGRYVVDVTGQGEAPPSWWSDFCSHAWHMNQRAERWCQGDPGIVPVRITDVPPASIGRDGFTLDTVSLSGHVISITVQYGGGCEPHDFLLFMSPSAFAESHPVQANLYLMHEDNDDHCDALATETIRFDISPIARQHERFYGQPGDIRLNVFNFERTESLPVLYHPR